MTVGCFLGFFAVTLILVPFIGMDYFPQVDAGQLRLHLTVPTGTRIEETERIFLRVEDEIKKILAPTDLEAILDNIGIPTSGINLAYGDNITTSNFDGEILISLKEDHKFSTFTYAKRIREMLKQKFPEVSCFFQPADIVSQILNAGLPAPIDIQVTGRSKAENYKIAQRIRSQVASIPGAVDVTLHQITDAPQLQLTVDRTKANQLGFTQRDIASSLLISLSSSFQTAPGFWVNPENGVNYPVAVQTPERRITDVDDILQTPVTSLQSASGGQTPSNPTSQGTGMNSQGSSSSQRSTSSAGTSPQLLVNLATAKHANTATVVNHYKIQPVYDVFANIQGRDLGGVMADVEKIVNKERPNLPRGSTCFTRGQAQSMTSAFLGLASGLLFAITLVYLLLVINFQSWTDPMIILMAIPGALAGILWILFATQTTFSVPALMGAIVSIGVASANSILLVTFANEQLSEGFSAVEAALNAGFTRFRPVVMTAAAMIIGMLPMALGLGEGGAQNAPLGRAVIGGLAIATVATLLFVPCVFAIIRHKPRRASIDRATELLGAGRTL
jgi:Cation/multidrug efflux pump